MGKHGALLDISSSSENRAHLSAEGCSVSTREEPRGSSLFREEKATLVAGKRF